jgi:amino acid transporter
VVAGQSLVALVYGALSVRVPLSGYSYQWASRLANTHVGWWFGWMSFAFLTIVTVSVDYGLIWLAYELVILIGPKEFRDAQYYVLGALGVGLVFYVVQLILEPRAMRTEPGQEPQE